MSTTTTESKTPRTNAFRQQRLKYTGTPVADYAGEPEISFARQLETELTAAQAEILGLREALERAQQDINWMLNNRQFLNGFVFDYIEQALSAPPPPVVPASALQAERDHSERLADMLKDISADMAKCSLLVREYDMQATAEAFNEWVTEIGQALAAHEARKEGLASACGL